MVMGVGVEGDMVMSYWGWVMYKSGDSKYGVEIIKYGVEIVK